MASHWMGGEITWVCQGGGDYVFQLKLYRDCNGVVPSSAQLNVWNHPTLSTIPLTLQSQTDISPACNPVAGGPLAITCASGGAGAVEEYVFISNPVAIAGVPPAAGWQFTWDGFSRNSAVDNLVNPDFYGITLRAGMYAFNGMNAQPCFDSSPQFAERPSTILCTGSPFRYNQNAYDPDLDSLAYSFGAPLDDLNGVFNPGIDPIFVPFETNYSQNSPLPGVTQNPLNVPATINPSTGEVSFTSYTQGNFVVVVKVESWRCGQLIAEVYREIQTVLLDCSSSGTNTPPVVNPPFTNGTWSDTVYAGEVVTFSIASTDVEFLQDGSAQNNILLPTGAQFGANFNSTATGCANPPCAVLSDPMPHVGSQGVGTQFTWQTDCSHLNTSANCNTVGNTHNFVFKFTDDFCPAPGIQMPTVSITVLELPKLPAPEIRCASVLPNGDVDLTWINPSDPQNSFAGYNVYSSTSALGPFALIGTIGNAATSSFTHIGADAQNGPSFYYLTSLSGCSGSNESVASDTLETMFLQLNPLVGIADLNWNEMHNPNLSTANSYYHIFMEYPAGTWSLIDSVAYGSEMYDYVVNVCQAQLNFMITLTDDLGCTSVSSVVGDVFEDATPPDVPIMSHVSVDTSNSFVELFWNVNPSQDTQGYIIYQQNPITGQWIPMDTIYGINNTVFVDINSNANNSSLAYGVIAFDSCWTGSPPSPNTSALGLTHKTIHLQQTLRVCEKEIVLDWTPYDDVNNNLFEYEVYASKNNGPPMLLSSLPTSTTSYLHQNLDPLATYCYVIRATFSGQTYHSLSNKVCKFIYQPSAPTFNYLQAASVLSDNQIEVRVHTDLTATVNHYVLLRDEGHGDGFESVLTESPVVVNPLIFADYEVDANEQYYQYRVVAIDSCGDTSQMVSNIARTIYLDAYADSDNLNNIINWSAYEGFDGALIEYRLYRGINGVFDATPIAILPPNLRAYQDNVEEFLSNQNNDGRFCYYVEAIEASNSYNIAESVYSNENCAFQDPIFWIPDAFNVNSEISENQTFKPVSSYIEVDSYQFRIFNRWGQIIFETTDINVGWDGRYKGDIAEVGVYVYQFTYTNAEGKTVEHRGPVTLLR